MKFLKRIWEERSKSPALAMIAGGLVIGFLVLFTSIRDLNDPDLAPHIRVMRERELRSWYGFFIGGAVLGFLVFKGWNLFDRIGWKAAESAEKPPPDPEHMHVGEGARRRILEDEGEEVLVTETSRGKFVYTFEDRDVFSSAMDWRVFDSYREGLANRDPSWLYQESCDGEADAKTLAILELIKTGKERELTVVEQKRLGKFDSENSFMFDWFGSPVDAPDDYRDGFVQVGQVRSAHGMLLLLQKGELNEPGQRMLGAWLARCQPELFSALVGSADVPERADSLKVVLESFFELASEPGKEIGELAVKICARAVHRQLLLLGEENQASKLAVQVHAAYPDIEL